MSFAPRADGPRRGAVRVSHDSGRDTRRIALQGSGGEGTLPVSFDRLVVDSELPASVLEKAIADLDGDGRQDAIVGIGYPSSGGIYWYRFPHSGDPRQPWKKSTIVGSGSAYEDMLPADMNSDGAIDVVASHLERVKWFENPRGEEARAEDVPWTEHDIGAGAGENNMVLADLDGDGVQDLATNAFLYFRSGPEAWTAKDYGRVGNGVGLLDVGDGEGAVHLVGILRWAPHRVVWFENPRAHEGVRGRTSGPRTTSDPDTPIPSSRTPRAT